MPHNLFLISPFFIITSLLLISSYLQSTANKIFRWTTLVIVFLLFIAVPAIGRKEYLANELLLKLNNIRRGRIFAPEIDNILTNTYQEEVKLIRDNITDSSALIISADDTYLLYMSNKKNLLDMNPGFGIDLPSEMEKATHAVAKACPSKIVVDCQVMQKCQTYTSLTRGWPNILPILLSTVETKCQTQYKPTICTNKLCIAESRK